MNEYISVHLDAAKDDRMVGGLLLLLPVIPVSESWQHSM
jgi:hypothetical protein